MTIQTIPATATPVANAMDPNTAMENTGAAGGSVRSARGICGW